MLHQNYFQILAQKYSVGGAPRNGSTRPDRPPPPSLIPEEFNNFVV